MSLNRSTIFSTFFGTAAKYDSLRFKLPLQLVPYDPVSSCLREPFPEVPYGLCIRKYVRIIKEIHEWYPVTVNRLEGEWRESIVDPVKKPGSPVNRLRFGGIVRKSDDMNNKGSSWFYAQIIDMRWKNWIGKNIRVHLYIWLLKSSTLQSSNKRCLFK